MAGRLSALEEIALGTFAAQVRERFLGRLLALELFGSLARGEGRDDSDLDVFVAVKALTRAERNAVIDDAADLGVAHWLVISPLVVDAASWREDLPLAREIAREGVAL